MATKRDKRLRQKMTYARAQGSTNGAMTRRQRKKQSGRGPRGVVGGPTPSRRSIKRRIAKQAQALGMSE